MPQIIVRLVFAAILSASLVSAAATPEERAASLVKRMSLEEKVAQMQDRAPAIPRLGIPAYGWWNEALHGVARDGLATVFPQAIGRAASWDADLEFRIGDVISTEARAKFNAVGGDKADHKRYGGLTFWSPNINIFRDPRWGRGQETFGEDPYLTGQIALQFIRGLQGRDARYFKTIATSKHFAVHSGPETGRHGFDARVSNNDLDDTYLRAFRMTLSGHGADSVMCAYNRVDEVPACANQDLLETHLRKQWGFRGYVVSDCGAIHDIFSGHHFTSTLAAAAAKAVKAGTDLTCGTEYKTLVDAVKDGLITEAEIDRSVTRLMAARIRLGLFDANDPFQKITATEIASGAHAALALESAEKSMVLLKNDGVLPLKRSPAKIAVIGPAADEPDVLLGNYYGTPPHIVTPLAGITKRFAGTRILSALGSVYAESMTAVVPAANFPEGLRAEYFDGPDIQGKPSRSRHDDRLYFQWAMRGPSLAAALPRPTFSAVWHGKLRPSVAGTYQIGLGHQECDSCPGQVVAALSIDGKKVLEESRKSATGAGVKISTMTFEQGKTYDIQVEYRQIEGGSGIELVWAPPAPALLEEATRAAKEADTVLLFLGLNSRLEGEELKMSIPGFAGGDRTSLDLPSGQQALLSAVLATGKPVVVVLMNGSALAVNEAAAKANAILEAWYPGQEGGEAIARTLAGDNNPAGRLPVTFYRSVDQLPPFIDYSMNGRTYRYFDGKPLFPFGYGLSYSTFRYQRLEGNAPSVRVSNVSSVDGDEVVELYEGIANGHWQLAGFKRIHLRAGRSQVVRFPALSNPQWQIAGNLPE